jgi:hypothetical protein
LTQFATKREAKSQLNEFEWAALLRVILQGHRQPRKVNWVNATVPLWAFVTLGLVAPVVTLIGVVITTQAENRRSHRNWLYQTKSESYERLFATFSAMCDAYRDYLDPPIITNSTLRQLTLATNAFKSQYARTSLVSSLRVGFNMEIELQRTLIDINFQIMAAEVGKPAPTPHRPWGESSDTRDAARYDLRVRQDPEGWRGKRKDRGNIVPSEYVNRAVRSAKAKKNPVKRFVIHNPYEPQENPDDADHGHPDSRG